MSHSNIEHTVLQTLLSRPFFTDAEYKALLKRHDLDPQHFHEDANMSLASIGLELRVVTSDYTNNVYFGVCQIYEDSNASECLGLKADVVQLFFKFLDLVINGEEKGASMVAVGALLDRAEGMPASQAQEAIHKLANLGYIEICGDRLRIGPRGLLEFRPTFTRLDVNGESVLQHCAICLDVALAGVKCPQCETYVHKRCAGAIEGRCPVCKCTEPFIEFGM